MNTQKKQKFFSIKLKLLITLVVSALFVMSIVGVAVISQARSQTVRLMNMNISGNSEAVRSEIDNYIGNMENGLFASVKSPAFCAHALRGGLATKPQVIDSLERAMNFFPAGVSDIFMTSRNTGIAINMSGEEFTPDSEVFGDLWWKKIDSGESALVSRTHKNLRTGAMTITIAAPILSQDAAIGYLAVDLPLQNLIQFVSSKTVGQNGYAALIDNFGYIISDPHEEFLGMNIQDSGYSQELTDCILGEEPVFGVPYRLNGEKMHGVVLPLKNVPWKVLGTVSNAEYQDQMHMLTINIGIGFLAAILFMCTAILVCITIIMKPINQLQKITGKLAAGDLNVSVSLKSHDETMILGQNIAQIVQRLKTYIVYIQELSQALDQIGNRNLVFTLDQSYDGEFKILKDSLLNIQKSLTSAMASFMNTANSASASSENMASGAQNLAQGTTEQASTVEELAASIEVMTARTKTDAQKATETSQQIQTVRENIENSNRDMKRMVSSMSNINGKAREISQIVSTVEDLAFQTNILSLNAAIEAAHAGSAGKGFAVVANEVRNLAGKSSDAARTISQLISDTNNAVAEGVSTTEQTAQSLNEATKQLLAVVASIDEILNSYILSVQNLEEFSAGISQISAVVQTNSATSEQSAAAAQELAGQVENIRSLIGSFKTE